MKKLYALFLTPLFVLCFSLFTTSASAQLVSAGEYFSTAKCSPCDNVFSWGANWDGYLGDSTLIDRAQAGVVHNLSGVTAVSAGGWFTLALRSDSTVWAWGPNWDGYIGDGTYIDRLEPVKTNNLTGIKAISAGVYHSLALKSDGTVWAWGYNGYGELGDSTTIERTSPVQVKGLTNVIAISAGEYHSMALKSDGTVWTWGRNSNGQLGDSTTINKIYRVQVKGLSGITKISAGYDFSLALKSDGTLWSWGYNGNGRLGDGTTVQKIYRVQVLVLLNNVIDIEAGQDFALAIKNDNTVWGWGYNGYGQLGDNTTTQRTSPVQALGGLTNVTNISAGGYHSLAMRSNGTVWAWGYNYEGQVGNGISNNEYHLPQRTLYLCPSVDKDIDVDVSGACTSIGTIPAGGNIQKSITVHNWGCDTLLISNVSSGSGLFQIYSFQNSIAPLDSELIDIAFTPAVPGTFSTTITVFNNNADTAFCVTGVATVAPVASVSPSSFNITLNSCNDSITQPLTINNTGGGPLNYTISTAPSATGLKLQDGFETGNYSAWTTGTGSYSRSVVPNFPASGLYSFKLVGGAWDYYDGIYRTFTSGTPNYISYKFKSPVGSADWNCGVVVGRTSDIFSSNGIADSWIDNANMKVYLHTSSGNLNTTMVQGQWYKIEFRNINYTTKKFDYYVDGVLVGANLTFWNQNITSIDVIHLMGYDPGQTSYFDEIVIGNLNTNWLYPSPLSGTSAPSGSSVVNLKFKSSNVVDGTYYADVMVSSNDPANPQIAVPCTLTVNGTPNIDILLPNSCPKFDTLFVGATDQDTFQVKNLGCDTLYISNISSSSGHFIINSFPAKISPYSTGTVLITFVPTTVANHSTTILVQNNDADTSFCLQGVSLAAPVMGWTPASFNVTLGCQDTLITPLVISNTGGNDLHFQVQSNTSKKLKVALVAADGTSSYRTDVQTKLMATGKFTQVDIFTANTMTPTLAQLQAYDAVLVWSNSSFSNATTLGNNLADYADGGGGVVVAVFATASNPVLGRFNTANYWCITPNSGQTSGAQSLGTVYNPNHPIMDGVTTFNGGTSSYREITTTVVSGATRVADWTDGRPLVATREVNGAHRVDLGFFPPSNTVIGGGWVASTNGALLMANALHYSKTGGYDWLTLAPEGDTVVPASSSTITATFISTGFTAGTYTTSVLLTSNDPANLSVSIPVTFTISGVADFRLTALYDTTASVCLDMDSIMAYTTSTDSIRIKNFGCDTLFLDSLKASPSVFTVVSAPAYLLPNISGVVKVRFSPVTSGSFTGTLSVYTNDADTTICLKGKAFDNPIISVTPTSLSATIANCNDSTTQSLTINNTGLSTLNYSSFPGTSVPGSYRYGLVANSGSNNVSVIDFNTKTIVGSPIAVGNFPWRVAIRPDGKFGYVSNRNANTISVINMTTRTVSSTITFGTSPGGICITPDGKYAYVGDHSSFNLKKIDLATNTIVATISSNPYLLDVKDLTLSPDGTRLYAATENNGITSINTVTDQVIGNTPAASGGGQSIVLSKDGSKAFVSLAFSNVIRVINTSNLAVITNITGFNQPQGLDLSMDGNFIYVIDRYNNNVKKISTSTYSVVATLTDARFANGWDLVVSQDGNYAYVSNTSPVNPNEDLLIVDLNSFTITGTLSTTTGTRGLAKLKSATWLSLSPVTSTINASSSLVASVKFNALGMNAGTYISTLDIPSNDPLTPFLQVPCTLTVIGTPSITLTKNCMYLDSIMVFTTRKDSLYIKNTGCATLNVSNITKQTSLFTLNTTTATVIPGDSAKLIVTYAPVTYPGPFLDTLTILSNDVTKKVCLSGKSFPNPVISVLPASLTATFNCTGASTTTLTVSNTGGSNLIYSIPFVTTASCTPTAGAKDNCCGMGIYNVTFNSINNTTPATDGRYNNYTATQSTVVQPGNTYTLSITSSSGYTEYARAWIDYNNNGNFESGELVLSDYLVQAHTATVTIPATAVQNTALRMRVATDYGGSPVPTPCTDAQYGQTEDYAVYVNKWMTVAPATGTVTPSSANTLTVTLNSANLTIGTYTYNITLNSNDPLNNPVYVPCSMTVVGNPNLNVSVYDPTPPCVDFDSIMAFTTSKDSILLTNAGCDTLRIDSLKFSSSLFSLISAPVKVAPGGSKKIVMQFAPVAAGSFSGNLTIYTNELDTVVRLFGKALPRPVQAHSPGSFNFTLGCSDTAANTLTVSNTGGSNLIYTLLGSKDSIVYSQAFVQGQSPVSQVPPWVAFRNQLTPRSYSTLRVSGSNNPVGLTLTDTAIVRNIAEAMNTMTPYTVSTGGNTWTVGINACGNGVLLAVNAPVCNCDGAAGNLYMIRPEINNANWGGINTVDCSAPSQTMNVTFTYEHPWLQLNPTGNTVVPAGSSTVAVTVSSTNLIVGTYTASVTISSNDPVNPIDTVLVTLNVVGASDFDFVSMSDVAAPQCLDLDSIMELTTSTDSIFITNTGCDTLFLDSLKFSPSVFSLVTSDNYILPGDTGGFVTRFSPVTTGTFVGTASLYTNDIDTAFCLKGISYPRPVQCHNPNSFYEHFLVCQDTLLDTLAICNTGAGNLNYGLWSPYGRSVSFNGTNQFIDVGGWSAGSKWTIEAWVKPASLPGGRRTIAGGMGACLDWGISMNNNIFAVEIRQPGGCTQSISSGVPAVIGTWYHIVGTSDGTTARIYVNGVLKNSGTVETNYVGYAATWIGGEACCGNYFPGSVDEVRIWDFPRTQSQIVSTMATTLNGNESGLQGYWHFDDSTATDFSVNTHNGTIYNGASISRRNVAFAPAPTGTVTPSGTYSVQVIFTKAGLASGTHNFPIFLTSNDPLNAVDTINVTFDIDAVPPSPTAGSNAPVCVGNNLSLTASTISGAVYAWTGPASFTSTLQNPVINGVGTANAGTYSVTAAVPGCPPGTAGTTSVVVNPAPSAPVAGGPGTLCSGLTLSLTASTISGATYSWTGPLSFTSTLQNPTIAGATTARSGTYSVTATVPGCPTTTAGTTSVTIYQTPTAPAAGSNSPICAGMDLSLTASTMSGVTYAWSGPNSFTNTNQNPVITAAGTAANGTYSVTASQFGCTGPRGTTAVIVNPPPSAPTAGSPATICSGLTLSLTASTIASAAYAWTGPNSFTSTLQNPTITNVSTNGTGTYSVTATVPGCPTSAAGTTSVTVYQTPSAPTATNSSPVCVGNDLSLTASTITGVTYSWTGPNSFTNTNQNPVITGASTAANGTYSVSASQNGCTGPKGITTATVNPAPTAPIVTSNSTVCSGNTLTLFASTISSAAYAWTGPNSFTASVQNPTIPGVSTNAAGTYSVTATVPGCPTGPAGTGTISINQTPVAPTAGNSGPVCSGQTLSLTATTVSGATYSWTGPLSFASTLQNPTLASVTTNNAGTYSVFSIVGGCPSAAGTTSVTIYQTPSAPSASSNSPVCAGFTLSLNAATVSGATYAWTGPNSFTDATQNPTIAGVSTVNAGTYSVTVTVNGCTGAAGTTSVVVNNAPSSPSAGGSTPICSGQTLSLNATTITGAAYSWNGPNSFTSTLQNPNIVSATTAASGTYSVSAVVGGCPPSAPGTIAITVNQTPSAPVASSNSPVCVGTTLSLSAATISGATYAWSGPNSFTDATQNPTIGSVGTVNAGTYSVSATVTGCTGPAGTASVVVSPPPATPTASNNSTICSGQTLSLNASTVSGATYSWTGPNSFTSTSQNPNIPSVTTAANGTYSVSAITPGCPPSAPGTTLATINQTPSAPVASANSPICVGFTLSLTASSAGTSYSWNGPASFTSTLQDPTIAGVTTSNAGTYSVTATALGCTGPAGTTTVIVNPIPAAPTAANQSACFGGTIPDLSATGSNIQWYDVAMTPVFSGNPYATGQTAAGTYTYYASQTVNGCTSPTTSVTLTINALPAAPNAGSDISICYGDPTPDLTAAGTNIQWYNTLGALVGSGSPFATGLTAPGSYTFIATQTNTVTTCESLGDTVVLDINSIAPPVAPDKAACFGNPTPDLTATGTNIQWYNSSMTLVFTGSPYATGQTAVGTYTYYVTQTNTVTTCVSPADTVYLVISTQPTAPPTIADVVACAGTTIPSLTATSGTIINWYSDAALANQVFTGNPYATGQTTAGTYTYFATDSTPGCPEGPSDPVTLTIHPQPATPVVNDTAVCFGSTTPDLIFNGTSVQWYNSAMALVFSGDTFVTGQTAVGTYTYYVSQTNTVTTCESVKDTVMLTIQPLPSTPSALDTAVCSAAAIPNLTSTGTNVQWYNSSMALVGSGNSFATGQTAAGTYTYYVTQADAVTGCESVPDTAILMIMLSPPVPTANNVAVCFGNPVPPLTSSGTNVKWYSSSSLSTLINTGNTYNTGQTAIGIYTYWVTDSLTGCVSSTADSVSLIINTLPAKPTANNVTLCQGTPAVVTSTGTTPHWFSDATLINMVGAGSPFSTGQTAVGTYTYYVTDYAAGCGNSPSDTVILTINANPLVTANTYSTTITQGNSTVLTAYNATTYLWAPGGQTTASIVASPTVTTTYTVTGTNDDGCPNTITILVVVNPLSVFEFGNALQDVSIYPNPAIDGFTLEFNTTLETPIHICMINMLGEKVSAVQSDGVQGSGLMKHKYKFDTSTLTEGIYNIEIVTDQGTVNRRVVLFR